MKTGKKIVAKFCKHQGYGSYSVDEEKLIKAIDDAIKQAKNISSTPLLSDNKIYHRGKELDYDTAKKVIDEFPEEDYYVQAHYQQFLTNGEHDDNTVESSNYWNLCKKVVGGKQREGKLTLQMLKDMDPGKVFAKGEILNDELPTPMVNPSEYPNLELCWVAKRGGYWDWAIYIAKAEMGFEYAKTNGDKTFSENNIRFLVPCDDDSYKMFRR